MECPKCKDEKAYVGMHEVLCPNPECENFSVDRLEEVVAELDKELDDFLDLKNLKLF